MSRHPRDLAFFFTLTILFFLAVPRRQEKTYPAALPACPIDVGCLGGIMGGFELLPPGHVFRNVFEAPRHPIMSQCPVRHPAPSPGRGSVRLSLTKNLCAAPVLTSTRSALPVGALARGGLWDPVKCLTCVRPPTGPDYVSTTSNNAHQEPSKGDGPCRVPFHLATVPIG